MDNDNQDNSFETGQEESFEELLNRSVIAPVHLNPGEKVSVVVTKITEEWVFIDLGGKREGYITTKEFMDDEGDISIKEGDTIEAYFLSSRNNEMLFATRLTGDAIGSQHLEDAYRNGIPVEGLVEQEVKGGFEVKIGGNVRAFCPFSQMGLHRVEKADQYSGEHLTFKIIEYGEKGRNIIVSNRAILEEELRNRKDELKESLKEGMTVNGEITSIRKFGAFVDVEGIEGLIPVSEISWGRVEDIGSLLVVGQKVDVSIKKLDWENDRFSFSLKDILPDPWEKIGQRYPEGSVHRGRVSRLAPFGAFVTLEPGIDGLIHISELGKGKKIHHSREVLEETQEVEVTIAKLDEEGKRISLKMITEHQDSEGMDYYRKHLTDGKSKTSGSFGTLGDLLREKMEKG